MLLKVKRRTAKEAKSHIVLNAMNKSLKCTEWHLWNLQCGLILPAMSVSRKDLLGKLCPRK